MKFTFFQRYIFRFKKGIFDMTPDEEKFAEIKMILEERKLLIDAAGEVREIKESDLQFARQGRPMLPAKEHKHG